MEHITFDPPLFQFKLDTHSVDGAIALVVNRLAMHYCKQMPDKSPKDFFSQIWEPIAKSQDGNPPLIDFGITDSASLAVMTQLVEVTRLSLMSQIYSVRGNLDVAWQHLSNAMYELGQLETMLLVDPASEQLVSLKGADDRQKREAKKQPLRDWLQNQVAAGQFTNAKVAAEALADAFYAEAARLYPETGFKPMSNKPVRLIREWLDVMGLPTANKL